MKKLVITEGEWIRHGNGIHDNLGKTICVTNPLSERGITDARLIADAGTTANKSGLLSSELLEQRDSLTEALKHALEILYKCEPPKELFETYANAFSNYNNLLKDIEQ